MAEQMASRIVTVRAARAFRVAGRFTRILNATWRGLARLLGPNYRPEQHYMRGPGPKWHARHSQIFGVINGDRHQAQ